MRSRRRTTALFALLALGGLLSVGGCPASPHEFPLDYTGTPCTPVAVDFYSDVPQVTVVVDGGDPFDFLVDTGAPATLLDVTAYDLTPGVYPTHTIEAFGLTVLGLECAALDLFGGDFTVGGIVGGDILRHFALTLDYRDAWASLCATSDGAPPPGGGDFGPLASRGFELRGGGLLSTPSGEDLRVPPTRVVLSIRLEGRDILAVVDTGASSVVLDEPLYELLLDERPDRPALEGYQVLTVEAAEDVVITRLASLAVEDDGDGTDATQTSVPALVLLGSDALENLSYETGREIQALLGGAFLRYYQLTIDYPARRLFLQPYLQTDHVDEDEYLGVGFFWEQVSTGVVVVDRLIPGSDAELQGVTAGDRILQAGPYDILLTGEGGVDSAVAATDAGDRVSFTLERNDATAVYEILVEDLLPEFQ